MVEMALSLGRSHEHEIWAKSRATIKTHGGCGEG